MSTSLTIFLTTHHKYIGTTNYVYVMIILAPGIYQASLRIIYTFGAFQDRVCDTYHAVLNQTICVFAWKKVPAGSLRICHFSVVLSKKSCQTEWNYREQKISSLLMLVLGGSQQIPCKLRNHCKATNCWMTCEPVSVRSCPQHRHTLPEAAELATSASLPESVITSMALLAITLHKASKVSN